jgi:hypothetical protein
MAGYERNALNEKRRKPLGSMPIEAAGGSGKQTQSGMSSRAGR